MESTSIHPASSKSWGDSSGSRVMQLIIESNSNAVQQIVEGKHDLLDLMSLEELNVVDDLDLNLPYLAIYYDRPEMLEYLHIRGVDLNKPCDPLGFGTPLFYAISMRRFQVVDMLEKLGYPLDTPCDSMGCLPDFHARRIDDRDLEKKILFLAGKKRRAFDLFYKNFLRHKYRKWYLYVKNVCCPRIQKVMRGYLVRKHINLKKKPQKKHRHQKHDDDGSLASSNTRSTHASSHHSVRSSGSASTR